MNWSDLKHRAVGAGNLVFTVVGWLAGAGVALGQALSIIPVQYQSNRWYVLAAGLAALGTWWKTHMPAPSVPPAALLALCLFALPARAQESQPTGPLPQAGACFAGGAACLQPAVTVVPLVIDFRSGDIAHDAAFSFGYGLVFAHMLNEQFRPGIDFLGGTQTGGGWNAAVLGRLGVLRLGPVITHKPGVMYAGMGVGVGM